MKRLLRRIRNVAATLSTLLCLATLTALPVSFFRALGVVRTNEQSSEVLRVVTGFVAFHDQRGPGMNDFIKTTGQAPKSWLVELAPVDNVKIYWEHVLSPRYYALDPVTPPAGRINRRVLYVPLWLLAAIFSLPKTLPLVLRRLRRPPPPPGACPACGYDRRATPDRCPECGTTRPPVPAPATHELSPT